MNPKCEAENRTDTHQTSIYNSEIPSIRLQCCVCTTNVGSRVQGVHIQQAIPLLDLKYKGVRMWMAFNQIRWVPHGALIYAVMDIPVPQEVVASQEGLCSHS